MNRMLTESISPTVRLIPSSRAKAQPHAVNGEEKDFIVQPVGDRIQQFCRHTTVAFATVMLFFPIKVLSSHKKNRGRIFHTSQTYN